MKTVPSLFFLIFALHCTSCFSQNPPPENQIKIAGAIDDYFKLDRENIHIHLNKTAFLTNEQIWFKGYIIEKKFKPTLNTSNVFISLIDSNGEKVATQLYYAEGNLFEGRIKLNKSIPSGKYYLQVFTNFMNNFSEDESSTYEISILNIGDKNYSTEKASPQSIIVGFFPESGIFLEGASNTIGVKITDCLGKGIAVKNAEITDAKGNLITTFSTDPFGYGKFEIYSANSESYSATIFANGIKIQKTLPLPSTSGITFSIDNYIFPDKTVVKIRTNAKTIPQIKNKNYTLVFQQNEATTFAAFSFKENEYEHKLIIPSSELNSGINTVYLLNENYQKIAERLIFKPLSPANDVSLTIASVRNDSIKISGVSKIPFGNFSVSVVPSETDSENNLKTIQAGLVFDNYLAKPVSNSLYYLADFTRKKHYELDNFLLSQKPKYQWDAIIGTAPQAKFESDAGLGVKGTVNTDDSKGIIFKINMNSLGLGLNEFTSLNGKREFQFEHLLAIDSTKIYFVAKDKNGKELDHKIVYQLQNNNRKFIKSFIPEQQCSENLVIEKKTMPLPKFDNAIMLDSINVIAKKNKFVNQNRVGNILARGFKISEKDANSYQGVLQFIARNGFLVSQVDGSVSITTNRMNAATGFATTSTLSQNKRRITTTEIYNTRPKTNQAAVFIDDMYIQNLDFLQDYSLSLVDEIYLNRNGNDISTSGTSGVIKIYTKKSYGIYNNNISNKSPVLIVKNGFQRFLPYQNPKYDNMRDEGFQKFGTIDWKPFVATNENGEFSFTIPNFYQKSVKIIIEGMSAEGEMISEIKTLNIP